MNSYKGNEFNFTTRIFISLFTLKLFTWVRNLLNPFCPSLSLSRCISVPHLFRCKYLHVQVAVLKCLPYWTLAVLGINQPLSPHYHAGRVVLMGDWNTVSHHLVSTEQRGKTSNNKRRRRQPYLEKVITSKFHLLDTNNCRHCTQCVSTNLNLTITVPSILAINASGCVCRINTVSWNHRIVWVESVLRWSLTVNHVPKVLHTYIFQALPDFTTFLGSLFSGAVGSEMLLFSLSHI